MASEPSRGEIWLADLNPTQGHEQHGKRPVLVVSTDMFNHGPAELIIIIPTTRVSRGIPFHVQIEPPEGGLKHSSYALCEAVRSISKDRLEHRLGRVDNTTLLAVEDRLRILLEL